MDRYRSFLMYIIPAVFITALIWLAVSPGTGICQDMFTVTAYASTKSVKPDWDIGELDKPEKEVLKLNETFGSIVQIAGAIIIALGIINLIMAFADQNMQSKTRGALMLSGGIALISIKIITKAISDAYDPKDSASVVKEVLDQIGVLMTYVGAVLAAYAIIQCILAYMNSSAEEKSNGLKGLAMAAAFLAGGTLMKGVKSLLAIKGKSYVGVAAVGYVVKYIIGRPAMYVGAGLIAYGLIQIIMGFKDEDANSKHQGSIMLIAGIALVSFLAIFNSTVGNLGSNSNYVMQHSGMSAPKGGWNQK